MRKVASRATVFARNVAIVFLAFLGPQAARPDTIYLATTAILSNRVDIQDSSRVGHIGGDDNGTVTFTNIVVATAGLYPMTVSFMVSDDRSFDITVNHEAIPHSVIFRRRSRGDEPSRQTVLVPLEAGMNTIAFDNPREYGPELAQIEIADAPVESHLISGVLQNSKGAPLAGAEVALAGSVGRKAVTDDNGHYEFKFLPGGEYRVSPDKPGWVFAPADRLCSRLQSDHTDANFTARAFPPNPSKQVGTESGRWRIDCDVANGVEDILFDGKLLFSGVHAAVHLPETVTGMDFQKWTVSRRPVKDRFGPGTEIQLESACNGKAKLIQTFWLYDNADYFLTRVTVIAQKAVASDFMAPFVLGAPAALFPRGDNRALFVPFDNDKWVRYDAIPFGTAATSYEVSAFYNNLSREGLVVGSIDHDTWKTGIQSSTDGGEIKQLEIFGGITSVATRDTLPHGEVKGKVIQSPRMFVGLFPDWRTGLEAFAKANTTVAPPRPWKHGVPFGWNSWGKLQMNVTFSKAIEVSDFFAADLQPHHFENDHTVYIGLDAGWNAFTDDELKQFVKHCNANHQEAGIYFTPFADFQRQPYAKVEGSEYQYHDLYLPAYGGMQRIAGGIALDPTHPGTQARIRHEVERFKKFGFKYVKADFLGHGSLEGDHFYDQRVTTGMQAYNAGMRFLDQTLGKNMYLNLAISPLFPSQYANSRRIACDSWGDIGKVEYTLDALTYGWWLGANYDFNDPDHVVLGGFSDGENRARVTSAVLTGLFISGDDFSKTGDPEGKEKAHRYLTNADIDALERSRKTFRPVEGNTGNRASSLFVSEDKKCFYLAALNYSAVETNMSVSFDRIGLKAGGPLYARELWSGQIASVFSPITIHIPAADAVVYQFYKSGRRPK